ncbi:MAG: 30S ribosomal protein S6 [Thermaerobacter sp.]|nr:30S ribosomal protein S6 [Thermaerobacter sp.]
MAKEYELALVLRPDLDEEHQQSVIARYRQVIENHGGNVEEPNAWGKRRLAYEIKDIGDGFYFFVPYTADSTANAELDRLLRIDDNVLRYMVVVRPRPNPPKPTTMPEAGPGAHSDGPRTGPTPAGDRPGPGLPEPRRREPAAGVESGPIPAPVPSSAAVAEDATAPTEAPTPIAVAEDTTAPTETPTPVAVAEDTAAPTEAPTPAAEPVAAPAETVEAPAADAEPTQE